MTEPTEPILEKRGYFWWDGEKTPKGRYAPPHGVPGVLDEALSWIEAVSEFDAPDASGQ